MAQRGFKSTFENWALEVVLFDRSSEALLRNADTGQVVLAINRNYRDFPHLFFKLNGDTWLFFGERYTAQTFYRLRDGLRFDRESGEIWLNVLHDGDGTLLVENAYWGDVYFTCFYDISHLEDGRWRKLQVTCNCKSGQHDNWCGRMLIGAANLFELKPRVEGTQFSLQLFLDWCPECQDYENPANSHSYLYKNVENQLVFDFVVERSGNEMVIVKQEFHASNEEKLAEYID